MYGWKENLPPRAALVQENREGRTCDEAVTVNECYGLLLVPFPNRLCSDGPVGKPAEAVKPYTQHRNNPSQGQLNLRLGYHRRRWPVKPMSRSETEGFIRK